MCICVTHQKGRGLIDKEDLWAVCRQFQLGVSDQVLDDLIKYCDTDDDRLINFKEFVNFLNWKDLMPLNNQEQRMLTNGQMLVNHWELKVDLNE